MCTMQTVKVTREMPGEYVRAGAVYTVTRRESGRGASCTAHFRNVATDGATSVYEHVVERAVKSGAMIVLASWEV